MLVMQPQLRRKPGEIRDAIIDALWTETDPISVAEIHNRVVDTIGSVQRSSVQSYLNNNQPLLFSKIQRGKYLLSDNLPKDTQNENFESKIIGKSELFLGDTFSVLPTLASNSIHAVVTDPPYGVVEYSKKEVGKLRSGNGGVWRIPPSFDGHKRAPLPRFTTLTQKDHAALGEFFYKLGQELFRVMVPGAHAFIASNPLVSHIVTTSMVSAKFENRGAIIRKVITMRGGDRPKNAHLEFPDVSVMARSAWEPWVLVRKPIEGRVQDNLRKWGTGGLRRISDKQPFFDVIQSSPTQKREKILAPHPSLKPQKLMRQLVKASLPLEKGKILDPFSGSGATLAAANFLEIDSVGIEIDNDFYSKSEGWIKKLSDLETST